jgi:hypothetical protein
MLWASYTEKHQALKLHLCFDLNRMLPVNFIIGSGNFRYRQALRDMLEAGVTYIADRGYMCFQLFDDIQKALSFFVFRVKNNLVKEVSEPLKVELPAVVQPLFSNVLDEKVQCPNDKNQNIYRLVRFQIGTELYCLLTNRFDLTTFQIICVYAYRWQIELLFRFLKRTMNGIHLIKNDRKGVTIQFGSKLITAILLLHLKQDILEEIEIRNTQNEVPTNDSVLPIKIEEVDEIPKTQNEAPINDSVFPIKIEEVDETTEAQNEAPINNSVLPIKIEEVDETTEAQNEAPINNSVLPKIEEVDETTEAQNKAPINDFVLPIKIEEVDETTETHAKLEIFEDIPSAHHFLNFLGKKTKKYWKISIHWLKALACLLAKPFDEKAIKILGEL